MDARPATPRALTVSFTIVAEKQQEEITWEWKIEFLFGACTSALRQRYLYSTIDYLPPTLSSIHCSEYSQSYSFQLLPLSSPPLYKRLPELAIVILFLFRRFHN